MLFAATLIVAVALGPGLKWLWPVSNQSPSPVSESEPPPKSTGPSSPPAEIDGVSPHGSFSTAPDTSWESELGPQIESLSQQVDQFEQQLNSESLVPTLHVGTHESDAPRPDDETRSKADVTQSVIDTVPTQSVGTRNAPPLPQVETETSLDQDGPPLTDSVQE